VIFRALGEVGTITLKDARDKARRYAGMAAEWKDRKYADPNPFAKPVKVPVSTGGDRTPPTFQQLVDSYCQLRVRPHANNPTRAEINVLWMTRKYFSTWRYRPVTDIGINDMLLVRNTLAARGKQHQANRCTELIKSLYSWSCKAPDGKVNFWKCDNPAADVQHYPEEARTRFLQPGELVRFNEQLQKETHGVDLRDFLVLALATAARKSNILSMKWEDVLWERRIWRVPLSKNGSGYDISLLPVALAVLERRHREALASAVFVFPGVGTSGHLTDLKRAWNIFRKAAGISDIRVHDLRRTTGSLLAIAGVNLPTIAEVLGHRSLQSTQVYARLNEQATRAAREAGQRKMITLMAAAKRRNQKLLSL
jgi:integrase